MNSRFVEGLLERIRPPVEFFPGLLCSFAAFAGDFVEALVHLLDDRIDIVAEFYCDALPY